MSPKRSLYDQAYSAVQNKDYAFARRLLAQLLQQEPDHLHGWLLSSFAANTRVEAIECLQRGLDIDPANANAKKRLAYLQKTAPDYSPDPSQTLLLHISAERQTVPPAPSDIPEATNGPPTKPHFIR